MMTKNKKIIILSLIASVAIFFGIYFGIIRNNASSKLAEKFNQAQEIKNRYQLNQVSLILPAKDKNSVEVKLGEKDAQEFIPNLELSKWEGEVKMKIKPQIAQAAQQEKTLEFENEKINFKTAKEDYRFYDIASNQEHPEGAYEFEVILKEKPQSNVVSLDIETENLDFFYQPPLTQKEIDRGDIMPENVIGSYAVYYKGGVSGDFSKIGGKNYKTGKAFHIYRPKVIDASNNWVWGGLQIDEQAGKMTITVPQNFLDKAVYPVIVDPTFGYEGIGATVASLANVITCWVASSTNTGTADNIQAHLRESTEANAHQFKGALYASSTSALLTNGTTTERQDVSTTGSWVTFSFPTPPTVTNGTNYNICMWSGIAAGSPYVASDVTTPGGVTDSETYGTWPDPGAFVASDIRYSIYVNYTAGAICGDGTCNGSETCVSCPADCGTCKVILKRDVILRRNVIFGRPCDPATNEVGDRTQESTPYVDPNGLALIFRAQADCSGTLGTPYFYKNDTNGSAAKICIYNSSSATPQSSDTLVGCSGEILSGATTGWKTGSIGSGSVTSGNYYWVLTIISTHYGSWGLVHNTTNSVWYITTWGDLYYDSDSFPATLGAGWLETASFAPISAYVGIQ